MSPRKWLPTWLPTSRTTARRSRARPAAETLEDRSVPSVVPNDPQFSQQWELHSTGQSGVTYDADMDMPAAWSVTTGSMATVVAVLDSGVDYTDPELYLNIWLNQGEIPAGIMANLTDADGEWGAGIEKVAEQGRPGDPLGAPAEGHPDEPLDVGLLLVDARRTRPTGAGRCRTAR